MSKSQTPGLWRRFTKKEKTIDIMKFTDIDVNFDITYEGQQNWSKIISIDILMVFYMIKIDVNLCEPHYVKHEWYVKQEWYSVLLVCCCIRTRSGLLDIC